MVFLGKQQQGGVPVIQLGQAGFEKHIRYPQPSKSSTSGRAV
jgi:hypothetical protein